jgi:hypothetical protein
MFHLNNYAFLPSQHPTPLLSMPNPKKRTYKHAKKDAHAAPPMTHNKHPS